MTGAAGSRPGGRTARTRTAVLDATVVELAEHGYGGLSVEAVAARAGVNKTTVYRRWGGKEGLLVEAVELFAAEQADVPDSGDVGEDLRRWAQSVRTMLTAPATGLVVRALFGGAGDSAQARDLRHRFWLIRSTLVRPVVDRAIARGQLPLGTDSGEVVRHVGAPLYYRLLVLDEPVTEAAADLAAAVTVAAARAGVFVPAAVGHAAPRTT